MTPGSHVAPRTMTKAAASAPPADTPISVGSASGLRNRPCISAPATASPAPVTTARITRGRRIELQHGDLARIERSGVDADVGREDAQDVDRRNAKCAVADREDDQRDEQKAEDREHEASRQATNAVA